MNKFLYFCVLFVFVASYFKVPLLFFQQDEILGLGFFIKEGSRIIFSGFGSGGITHFVPVTMSISYSIFSLFGLNYSVFNLLSLLLHFINTLLVYALGKRIFKNKLTPFIAVLIFISSNVAAELLMWPVINLNVISLTFSLLAWLVVIDGNFLKNIKGYFRMIFVTILFLLSLFSVEYSAGFAIFIPVAYCLLNPGKIKLKLIRLSPFILTSFIYFLFRIIPIVGSKGLSGVAVTNEIPIYLRWIVLMPRYFGQLFFGQPIILLISRLIGEITGPAYEFELYVETKVFPLTAFYLGAAIIAISVFIYRKFKEIRKTYSSMFLLTVLMIAFSSLPFLLVPGAASSFTIFPSRYMYFGLVGLALYLGFINDYFLEKRKTKGPMIILCFTILLIVSGTVGNYQKGKSLFQIGQLRLKIIKSIDSNISIIPQKLIIYTESDTSYYGLPAEEKILPFQSGFGQTLLLFLNQKGKFPRDFFPGDYLWEIKSQGYKEFQERGFGYFRNFDMMVKTVREYKLEKESVLAYRFNSSSNTLTDITREVRDKIGAEMVKSK
jgi:hypothetical protein